MTSRNSPKRWDYICCAGRKGKTYTNGKLGGVRQWIELVNQTIKVQFNLEGHGACIPAGVFTHIAQRLLTMAAGI